MLKRVLAMLLCLSLFVCALPMQASATSEVQEIRKQISRIYYRVLAATGKDGMNGYCGTFTGYQLYFLGIDTILHAHNGNDAYDTYKNLQYSSGGYRVRKYPASQYTLEEALYTISKGGTETVYNVLLGFQRTSSEAGQRYGHSTMIHAIIDGKVYFAESFNHGVFGPSGTPTSMTIADFAYYYGGWATFEGAIYFGKKTYEGMSDEYSSYRFVQLSADAQLYRKLSADMEEDTLLRQARAGERFAVDALMQDPDGRLYYRVSDDENVAYVDAASATTLLKRYEDVTLAGYTAPESMTSAKNVTVRATVTSRENTLAAIKLLVKDAQGEVVLSHEEAAAGCKASVRKTLQLRKLAAGSYVYEIVATVKNHAVTEGELTPELSDVTLYRTVFTVGGEEATAIKRDVTVNTAQPRDGWVFANNTWYCYDNGQPRVGWYCSDGVDYYLKEDGSITTGWAVINGKNRYFGSTGAMRTGWLTSESSTYYMLTNGVAAKGWQKIDEDRYYFEDNGRMLTDTWIEDGDYRVYLLSNGKMAVGWHEVEGETYFFNENGELTSQRFEKDGKTYIKLLREDQEDVVFLVGNN